MSPCPEQVRLSNVAESISKPPLSGKRLSAPAGPWCAPFLCQHPVHAETTPKAPPPGEGRAASSFAYPRLTRAATPPQAADKEGPRTRRVLRPTCFSRRCCPLSLRTANIAPYRHFAAKGADIRRNRSSFLLASFRTQRALDEESLGYGEMSAQAKGPMRAKSRNVRALYVARQSPKQRGSRLTAKRSPPKKGPRDCGCFT